MDIAPVPEPAGGTDEELGARRPRGPRLVGVLVAGLVAVGLIVAVVQAVGSGHPARHAAGPSAAPSVVPSPSPSPSPSTEQYVAGAVDLAGDRCPTAVSCGVTDTVAAPMLAAMRADFPTATVQLQLRAFDAAHPVTYWQQAQGRLPSGAAVVLTEQRMPTARTEPVTASVSAGFIEVEARRGIWHLTAELIGDGPLPRNAAAHWVGTAPVPR